MAPQCFHGLPLASGQFMRRSGGRLRRCPVSPGVLQTQTETEPRPPVAQDLRRGEAGTWGVSGEYADT